MKKLILSILLLGSLFLTNIFAFERHHGENHNKKDNKNCSDFKKDNVHCSEIEKFFYKKIELIFNNIDTLAITTEQIEQIKNLKIENKKNIIMKTAEIEVISLDIKKCFWKDTVDKKLMHELIDKQYNLKKEELYALVDNYISLQKILTEEQKNKMNDLCKNFKEKKQEQKDKKNKCQKK